MNMIAKKTLSDVHRLSDVQQVHIRDDLNRRFPVDPQVKELEWEYLRCGYYSFTMMSKEISICDQDDEKNPDITWWACFPSVNGYLEKGFQTLEQAKAWCQKQLEKEVRGLLA